VLKNQGIAVEAVRNQIKAQLAWVKVVQKEVRPRIDISTDDVDAELARLKANAGKPRYLTAEIFLSVDSPDQDAAVKAEADRLVTQLRQGGNFAQAARQFSQSAGANNGGDLGWVQQGQLPPDLEEPLSKLRPGEITDPIRDVAGYHILLLREIGTVAGADANQEKLNMVQIVLPAPPGKTAAVEAQAKQIAADTEGCDAAKAKATSLNDNVSGDLGLVTMDQLPPAIVNAVRDMPLGKFISPLRTPKGFLLLMVCSRSTPDVTLPSREEIANQIGFQRLDLQQRRYLSDLRASAYIDIRS
jgi:peptidyl-prolyl cis-trans isomerase SurA